MDVLDHLAEIPVCVGYKINGRKTAEIPAQISGYEKIECVYEKRPGWQTPTSGIAEYDKLPQKAKDYLQFIAKETGTKIGVVSTGPDREQTMYVGEFVSHLPAMNTAEEPVAAKSKAK
jgi:adenylosuccinate synthase